MQITVRLLSGMRKYLPNAGTGIDTCELDMNDGATVGTLLEHLNIPREKPKTILINRSFADVSRELNEGDTVSVFEPVSGG